MLTLALFIVTNHFSILVLTSADNTFIVYEHENFNSKESAKNKTFELQKGECGELTDMVHDVTSIDTNGNCIVLFEDEECSGRSIMIKPGCKDYSCCSQRSFVRCNFNDRAFSYQPCRDLLDDGIFWCTFAFLAIIIGMLFFGVFYPWLNENGYCRFDKPVFGPLIHVTIYAKTADENI